MFAVRVRAARDARLSKASPGATASAQQQQPQQRWRPWAEGVAPVRWEASDIHHDADAVGVQGFGRGTPLRPCEARWEHADGKHTFRADFDGGNLAKVERLKEGSYQLWTRADNEGSAHETTHRTWFHFELAGCGEGESLTFTVMNLNKQSKLFSNDFRPVFRAHPSMKAYDRLKMPVQYHTNDEGQFKFTFKHHFTSSEPVFFAFTFPFGYHDNEHMLRAIDARFADPERGPKLQEQVYYRREVLARSLEGRPVHVLTVTSPEGMLEETPEARPPGLTLEPPASRPAAAPPHRKIFFVSAGVHPGEKPANHMVNGVIEFLLRTDDPRARALRESYVFKIVPMLNPDGVYRGHYRSDTLGQNLNRCYDAPHPEKQPAVNRVMRLLTHYADEKRLGFYIDLHGHVNKRGCFAYGNALEGDAAAESYLFARLAALNNPHFDFSACNFTEKNMQTKDKNGESKEGSGRVALYKHTGLPHLYTVEANYNSSRLLGAVPAAAGDDGRASPPSRGLHPIKYTPAIFNGMGRGLLVAALDLEGRNPWSRLPMSEFKSLAGVRAWVASCRRAADGGMREDKGPTVTVSVSVRSGIRDQAHR